MVDNMSPDAVKARQLEQEATRTPQEKVLDKLRKIKAKAEGAKEIGSEAEAQAFADMLQKMLLDHKLSLTDLEFEQAEQESPVDAYYINYGLYPDLPLKRTRIQWVEALAGVVARAHFCRILVYSGSSRLTIVGKREDCQVAEYMFVTLYRAAKKLADRANRQYTADCHRREQRVSPGFYGSWIGAFTHRLYQRYEEERWSREQSSSTALMRISRSLVKVDQWMKDQQENGAVNKKASQLSRDTRFNAEGVKRGREAADKINLRSNAVGGVQETTKMIK